MESAEEEEVDDLTLADFDKEAFDLSEQRYGLAGLMRLRAAMGAIEKPDEVAHLKFFFHQGASAGAGAGSDDKDEDGGLRDAGAGRNDRKGKGKGKDKDKSAKRGQVVGGGRYVPEMGKTEPMPQWQRGQWWRNVCETKVIVRESFSLASEEINKIPVGHYVRQSGPVEAFVNGQAQGLQRMPVEPTGWVTVDATAVGGPKYLEPVPAALWKVVFQSGSGRGDIIVREKVSLDSEEVAVLMYGARVEQAGPSEILQDGIIRMPISLTDKARHQSSSPSEGPKRKYGWVTSDATAQRGPKFFEPVLVEVEQPPINAGPKRTEKEIVESGVGGSGDNNDLDADGRDGPGSFGKCRIWNVQNLEAAGLQLALVRKPEPFAPRSGKIPPEDMLVIWLQDGMKCEQVGHSKKTRGYMVMPVKILGDAGASLPLMTIENVEAHGWVTRRNATRSSESPDAVAWFEEVVDEAAGVAREKRRQARNRRKDADDN